MTDGWQKKRLDEVAEVWSGGTPSVSNKAYWNGDIPWYSSGELNDLLTSTPRRFITRAGLNGSNAKLFPAGSLLIGMYDTAALKMSLLDREGAFNQAIAGVKPNDQVDLSFVFHQINAIRESLLAQRRGVRQKNLSLEKIRGIQLSFPSPAEQRRIAGILEEAFESIATAKANVEKNLQYAHALFDSYLQTVFSQGENGWMQSSIGEQIRFIDYRGKTPQKTASGLKLITAKNVKMGYLQDSPKEFVAPESYDSWMTRGIPRKGDVLFTTEAPLANVAQLDTDEKVVFAQRIIIMQPIAASLDRKFLKYLLLSSPIQRRIHAKGTGATVQGIKASLLKSITISFPQARSEQEKIAAKLDSLNEQTQGLESIYRQKLAALDALKKSLLHQAFVGNL